jgi:hypothetical protein
MLTVHAVLAFSVAVEVAAVRISVAVEPLPVVVGVKVVVPHPVVVGVTPLKVPKA